MREPILVQPAFNASHGTALLVEDDESVRRMLGRHLERAGYVVRTATGEDDALRLADDADIAVVDLGLAQGTGVAVCERIRDGQATSTMPLVVLTARDDLATKLRLFAAGADDYLTKPFEPLELLARMEVATRRVRSRTDWHRIGPLAVSDDGDAVLHGHALPLTAAEREVIGRLAASYPGAAPHESLRHGSWRRSDNASDNVVEVLVGRIRKKLEAAGGGVEVRSVRRAGYVLRLTTFESSRIEGMVGR